MSESSRPPSRLPWLQRLEARVLLGVTLVVGASLLAMLVVTQDVVTRYSLDRSNHDLVSARAAFNRLVESRTQAGAKQARLTMELPLFQSLLADPGPRSEATANRIAQEYCRRLEADFCVVSDVNGTSVGQAHFDEPQPAPGLSAAINDARRGRPGTRFVRLSKGLFLIVAEPAYVGEQEVSGALLAGYRLDNDVARDLAAVSHCDVTFVCANGDLCGTSLPPDPQSALKTLLSTERAPFGTVETAPTVHALAGTPFVGSASWLGLIGGDRDGTHASTSDGTARLVLLQDWAPTERAIRDFYRAFLWVGFGIFWIALGGGLVVSRRMTRPLRDLAGAANEIAAGNWAGRAPVAGPAEARTLAEAFNRMTITISHWRKEAESQAAQVQEAYERFRAVTNSTHDAIVSVNRHGEIVFWNSRAQAVFGYQEHEALGQPLTMVMPERYRRDYAEEMARIVLGESRWLGSQVELEGVRRDGSEVPVELSLSTWQAGEEVFYTAVIRDITERRQAAEALRQREAQLRQAHKMEAVGRLAGGIAHDFNNLLTAILGYADLLLEDLPEGEPLRKDAEEIRKAGRSAASLIRELLAFSRRQVLQPVVLDMNAVVAGNENLMRRLIGEDILLVLALQPEVGHVVADRAQLEQVLVNLALNARQAMPGGGRLTVHTFVAENIVTEQGALPVSGRHVVLAVTDNGPGMSADTRARIFDPFFTTKPVGRGMGLGLATVYGIVQQSGGQIWVESEIGKGATFNVAFPVIDAAVSEAGPADGAQPAAKGSELVLLVEDNDSVRSLALETLVRSGYRVIEARNGEEALKVAASHLRQLSLLLTDVVMPIMGGTELANKLSTWRPDLKIIFTSGYIDDAVTRQATVRTGSAFLQKPFTPAALGRAVREVLDTPQAVS